MSTNVNYTTLKQSEKILNESISDGAFYKVQNTLTEFYEWLKNNNKSHECFANEMEMLNELQEDSVKPTELFLQLTNIIPQIIKEFENAENNTSDITLLKDFIQNYFSNTSIGLFPFVYHEIQKLNDNSHGIYDLRIQGYTKAGNYYLITAYDHNHKLNSRVYIYDKVGNCVGYIELKNKNDAKSHVGGISYDEENDILFITGKGGAVNTYKLKDIIEGMNQSAKVTGCTPELESEADISAINNGSVNITKFFNGKNTSAATTYYSAEEKALYVADCAETGTLIKYSISATKGKVNFSSGKVVSNDFASCCQGVATYKDAKGNNYIYASQSYGSSRDSVIKKYEVTDSGLKEVGATIIDTPGLEGIQIDSNGNLSGVFENFKDTDNPNKTININVNTADFSKTLSETRPDLEWFYQKKGEENQRKLN